MQSLKNKDQRFVFAKDMEVDQVGEGVTRMILAFGDDLMAQQVNFEEGGIGTMHQHPHTQLSYVLEGEFEFTIGDEKKIVKKGDTLYKLPNVMHGCVCLKKGALLDVFNPKRDDFIKETAGK